ncbi:MAG: acetate/propionate family kinase [Betaproteobacteria bacterium]|nr:acetate/propionate family kinase [Betaproteobacteria bacterium]
MTDTIAVLNAGSSSLKFSVFGVGGTLTLNVRGQVEGIGTAPRFVAKDPTGAVVAEQRWDASDAIDHAGAVEHLFSFLATDLKRGRLLAVGHRVVHGGTRYGAPVRVDADVIAALADLVPLAPLHQPHNLAPIRAIAARMPAMPQVACFDTAFHHDQPPVAQAFALPPEITGRGVRRYGFHGLSYEYVAGAMRNLDMRAAAGRVVVAHLGNGASMCAMANGRSVASTMGFTALDGLVMGTRSGTIDPGVLIWLMDEMGMGPRDLERLLYHRSGLLGVSGVSSDMRTLLASDEPRAKLAIELFCYRAGRELGSLAAALGGLDALVFTGGIGEHAAPIRAAIVHGASWLGLALDEDANAKSKRRITSDTSRVPAYVVPTDEELMIARHVRSVLGV